MSPRLLVASGLLRIYRPTVLWIWGLVTACVAIAMTAVHRVTDPTFSMWLVIAGNGARYWLGVVGVLLISMHLRQFVTNGITRRDFLAGAAIFGLAAAVLFALIVPVGHGVEQVVLRLAGPLPADYPTVSAVTMVREFGQVLSASLAFLVTGTAAAAGFYRFGAWGGLALVIPALLPFAVAEGLLGADEHGDFRGRLLPYGAAILVTLAVAGLGALLCRQELRAVAIRAGTTT